MSNYKLKYEKYKNKYNLLKQNNINIKGGNLETRLEPHLDSGDGDEKVKKNLVLTEKMTEQDNLQNWNFIRNIYDENLVVVSFDGTVTKGRDKHLENMKQMFVMAPDVKVKTIIQFGSGDWVALIQIMTGTFTGAIKIPTGQTIQPTNKKFKMNSCVLMRWKNEKIVEFRTFWDQKSFEQQLGLSENKNNI